MNLEEFLAGYFGAYAMPVWTLLASIEAATEGQSYSVVDTPVYDELVRNNPKEAMAIYWREMLFRIHFASCSSIRRHADWLRSTFAAVESDRLFGAYASYRGFLESAADSFYSLGPVAKTIGPHVAAIRSRLREKPTDTLIISEDLENRLIHFSHARSLQRGESADPVHAAKKMRQYLDGLRGAGVQDVHTLYSDLCELTHPSAYSAVIGYEAEKSAQATVWRRQPKFSAKKNFMGFLERWRASTELVYVAAFVPAFMSLRILHKFDFLPKIPSLKAFPVKAFPGWQKIEKHLNR
jgi:hypothetical protein